MKVSCDIIRDLLPLYAENMVSQASRDMVDEHLRGCGECTGELGKLQKTEIIVPETDVSGMKRVEKAICTRRLLAVATAVLAVLSIFAWLWGFMNAPVYLSAEDAIVSVEQQADNALTVDYYDYVRGWTGIGYPGCQRGVICSTTRWDWLSYKYGWRDNFPDNRETYYGTIWEVDEQGRKMPSAADAGTDPAEITQWACDKNMWYINYADGTRGELLWEGEKGENLFAGQTLAIADRTLLYACIGAAVLAVITGPVAWMIKTPGGKRLCTALSTAAAAYALSSVLITGGQLICYSGYRPQLDYMITLSVLLTATAFCAIELYKVSRRDKTV